MSEPSPRVFTILLFAVLREKAGCDEVEVNLPCGARPVTVADVLTACGEQHPLLAPWLPHVKAAVNCSYARATEEVRPWDEIALLPPVAGGAH